MRTCLAALASSVVLACSTPPAPVAAPAPTTPKKELACTGQPAVAFADDDGQIDHVRPWQELAQPELGIEFVGRHPPTLLDQHAIRYVTSLAQLADAGEPVPLSRAPALVVADPHYPAVAAAPSTANVLAMRSATGQALSDMVFQPLPETRAEGEQVRRVLQGMGIEARLLTGAQATTQRLREAVAPAVLHVASHGVLLSPAPEADATASLRVRERRY